MSADFARELEELCNRHKTFIEAVDFYYEDPGNVATTTLFITKAPDGVKLTLSEKGYLELQLRGSK